MNQEKTDRVNYHKTKNIFIITDRGKLYILFDVSLDVIYKIL